MANGGKFNLDVKAILNTSDIDKQLKTISRQQKIKIQADGTEKVVKDIKTMKDEMGNVVKVTTTANTQFKTLSINTEKSAKEQEKLKERLRASVEQINKMEIASQKVFKEFSKGSIGAKAHTEVLEKELKDVTAEMQRQILMNEKLDKASVNSLLQRQKLASADLQAMKQQNISTSSSGMGKLMDMGTKVAQFGLVTSAIGLATTAMSSMVQEVFRLDDAFTELNKVTDLTKTELDAFKMTAFDIGSEVGRTGEEVVRATATFSRMGYELSEATNLAKNALIMSNIADGLENVEEAAQTLTGILKGFGLEATQTMDVLDVLNEVDILAFLYSNI